MVRVDAGRWTPALIAFAAFAAVVGGGVLATRGDDGGSDSNGVTPNGSISLLPSQSTSSVEIPTTTGPVVTVAPNSVEKHPISGTLSKGMAGEDVKMVQQRLMDLDFNPGPVDGVYGTLTVQAVWAFEKLVLQTPRSEATGKVTPEMWDVMQDNVLIEPRRTDLTSTHVEIYLPEQVLIVFKDNKPELIAHISSGELAEPGDDFTKGAEWCEEVTISPGERGNEDGTEEIKDGKCGNAVTPGGTYKFYKKHDGVRQSALGGMYKPVYFNYGIAVHGAQEIPLEPASHGCIRMSHKLADIFFDMITKASGTEANPRGDSVWVWNGVKEPEVYGQKTGIFDWPWQEWRDKNSTTSSSSSTSSTSSTSTLPGATTTTPATTVPSATSTTAAATTTTTTTTAAPPPPATSPGP